MENQTEMLILTLPQVIDAALTGPEMGIVSYRLLNNILQVLCQQLNLEEVKVQYQGMQAMQIQKIWSPEIKSKLPQLTTVKRKKLISTDDDTEEKIVVIPDGPSETFPAMTLAISNVQLQNMERNIRSLQEEVSDLKTLPSNNELFRAVKSKSGEPSPIVDMYQILSVTKRMDATDEAIIKIASFVEDLARYIQSDDFSGTANEFDSQADKLQSRRDSAYAEKRQSRARASSGQEADKIRRSTSGAKHPKTLDIGSLGKKASSSSKSEKAEHPLVIIKGNIGEEGFTEKRIKDRSIRGTKGESSSTSKAVSGNMLQLPDSKLIGINMSSLPTSDAMALIQDDLKDLRSIVHVLCNMMKSAISVQAEPSPSLHISPLDPLPVGPLPVGINMTPAQSPMGSVSQTADERICQIELRVNQCISQINKLDSIFSSSYSGITNRMAEIESSLKLLSTKALHDVGKTDLEEQLAQNIFALNEKVSSLENVASKLVEGVAILTEENNANHNNLISLVDDCDHLKSDKIGREEFHEALAEKVDICMINRKVSHDQFNATCDDLSKGIEEALEKLIEQEDLWHIALREIQEEISDKLSKDDLTPLREFVTDKLKGLQHKVKTLTKIKQEQEAAATKSKFLKDVQCISCDQDVIMRKKVDETFNYPGAPMLPPTKNMAPYLAYELDRLRKQQRQMQYGKNLNHFESATKDGKGVINRYCGGPHTITTPQQRVTRIGNFAEQWGPKSLQIEKATGQCQSDRNGKTIEEMAKESRESLDAKRSKESLVVKNVIKVDQAEKDESAGELRKQASWSK